jgi:hypothetical protein
MLSGGCLCGEVRYELEGRLGPVVFCHCSQCRRGSGSAFATDGPVRARDLHLVAGRETLAEYESSPGKFRTFCPRCGSPIYSRLVSAPDVLRLRLGSLDEDPGARPVAHVFTGAKAPWFELSDDLPRSAGADIPSTAAVSEAWHDWSWTSEARPTFRFVAFLVAVASLILGASLLLAHLDAPGQTSSLRTPLAMLGWGAVLLLLALRGRLFGRRVR